MIQLRRGTEWVGTIILRKKSVLPRDPAPFTPCWQVSSIEVREDLLRQGFGTLLYEEAARVAAKHGLAICSDTPDALSNPALAFWEKQVAQGRAYWEVPGPPDREGWNYDYGRFVMRAPAAGMRP